MKSTTPPVSHGNKAAEVKMQKSIITKKLWFFEVNTYFIL
jgi:hypothetical protein